MDSGRGGKRYFNNWDRSMWGGQNRGGYGRGGRGQWHGPRSNFRNGQGQFGGYRGGNKKHFGGRQQNNQWKNRPKRDAPTKRLSEEEIGVTEYINDHEGFNGIIKSRYSDFQVSEINEAGEVAKLTDVTPPEAPEEECIEEDEDLLLNKYNLEILPMETWDRINSLAVCTDGTAEKVEIDVTGMSKIQRTKIHDAVKKAFGESIVGSTVTVDEKKLVCFDRYRKGVRIDTRVKWTWPAEYVYFIVHKENCDTMEAATRIADRLRLNIKPSMLGYAGTKDRRAKTSQWFSLRRVDPRKVVAATSYLRDIHVGNFTFHSTILKLGMLKGNKFRIALRNVTADEASVDQACSLLKERGFINYYGLQRFGTRIETPTYDIGRKLLQGNFKEAIDSILERREGPLQGALQMYASGGGGGGAAAALDAAPRGAAHAAPIETRLLRALAHAPNDLLGAMNKVSRNTRLLYLHSYQSLVWNRCVSERLRRLGLAPAAGDLVPLDAVAVHDQENMEDEESDNEDTLEDTEDNDARKDNENKDGGEKQDGGDKQDGDDKQNGDEKNGETQTDKDQSANDESNKSKNKNKSVKPPKAKIPVKVLTQEDVDSGKYTIFDIVLPLPGYNIEYPPNIKDYYEELLAKDNLNLELKHKIKSYSMSGAYRLVVIRPLEMSWRVVNYSDPFTDLILSDLDELNNKQLTGIVEDGKYKALLVTMSLPASCYATMALRELMKVDTSCDNQALQNNYHKKKDLKTEAAEGKEEKQETEENTDKNEGVDKKEGMEVENGAEKRKLESEDNVDVKKLKQDNQ